MENGKTIEEALEAATIKAAEELGELADSVVIVVTSQVPGLPDTSRTLGMIRNFLEKNPRHL